MSKLTPVAGRQSPPLSLLDNIVISNEREIFNSRIKIVVSGKIVEAYEYEYPVWLSGSFMRQPLPEHMTKSKARRDDISDEERSLRTEQYQQRRVSRAKTRMRRLIQSNFDQAGKFLTLTFRDTDKFDINSLSDCNKRKTYFLTQLRKSYPDVKFVAVPEFQKRGAVHYHLILDLPYVPIDELRVMWQYGFVRINKIYNPAKVGSYIAKYLAKNVEDPRFKKHRCFSSSKNLDQPKVHYGNHLNQVVDEFGKLGIDPVFEITYASQNCGMIKFRQYNFYKQSLSPAQKEIEFNGG